MRCRCEDIKVSQCSSKVETLEMTYLTAPRQLFSQAAFPLIIPPASNNLVTSVASIFRHPFSHLSSRSICTVHPRSGNVILDRNRASSKLTTRRLRTPHIAFPCPSAVICVCGSDGWMDVGSWVEGRVVCWCIVVVE